MMTKGLVLCCGTLLIAVAVGRGEDPGPSPVVSRGEEWLGEGSDLGLEMAHVVAKGKQGKLTEARLDLERIAGEAEARGLPEVRLKAQQWWVRFTLQDQPEADLTPAVEQLLRQARAAGLSGEEAGVFALWGEVLEAQGQWLMAVKAQDRATQAALDQDRVPTAVESFLEMARLCREAGHAWRLQQVWVRVDRVLRERKAVLAESLQGRVDTERSAGAALLARAGQPGGAAEDVDLQPKDTRIVVSAADRELGRSRFLLTNATAFTVSGTLRITSDRAGVSTWDRSENSMYATLAANVPEATPRTLKIRPGQQFEVFVEHAPELSGATAQVTWADSRGSVTASGTFYSGNGQPSASVVNAGVYQLRAGWNNPVYHEIYHRGKGSRVQNLEVSASAPCRLELFDYDTGQLLAVDADGDGFYNHAGDEVVEDADRDGWPDLVVGSRARAIEICAWPLGTVGSGITVNAGLRGGPDGSAGSPAVRNRLDAGAPAVSGL